MTLQSTGRLMIEPGTEVQGLSEGLTPALPMVPDEMAVEPMSTALDIFHGSISVFVVAFVVTLLATPVMRWLAVRNGVVDHPTDDRKQHRAPVAYLGGVAVFLGLISAIGFSYVAELFRPPLIEGFTSSYEQRGVPFAVVLGLVIIVLVGLFDDVVQTSPRIKIAGQFIAAAALAMDNVGTRVATALLQPIGRLFGNEQLNWQFILPVDLPIVGGVIPFDLVYWVGVAIIAIFVLGACNASNLLDGLDGLCTGVTSIAAAALLLIALMMAASDDGALDSGRVYLALALLGATLGFLPHNFRPATIFLGDAGSLLLGYTTIVLVLSLGDTGRTHLVVAGLIIYSVPIIDTTLALVRRKLARRSLSAPDDQHLHHMLERPLGTTGAVLVLYGIAAVFAGLGLWLSLGRVRVVMTIAIVIGSFIGVFAVKVARRQAIESQAMAKSNPRRQLSGRPSVVTSGDRPSPPSTRPTPDNSPESSEPETA